MAGLNWLDRSIAFISPAAGVSRARQRAALDFMATRYAGGRPARGSDRWAKAGSGAGPNAALAKDRKTLRDRSRSVYEDIPEAKKGINSFVNQTVGWGILPRAKTGNVALDKLINDAWDQFNVEADADGQLDFYGMQALAVRTILLSGEVLIRYRGRRMSDGLLIPFQLQMMEPDHIDDARSSTSGDTTIVTGIELDGVGKRKTYWLFPQHPGEVSLGMPGSSWRSAAPIPAWQILHVYQKERPGLMRGVPWLHPVLNKMRDLGDYDDAELMRKNVEACLAAFVTSDEGGAGRLPVGAEDGSVDAATGARLESFSPGMVEYLRPGEAITIADPKPGSGYKDFMAVQQRSIAAGMGVTYEQMTGDLTGVNWSSFKAGAVEFQRAVEMFRWLTLTPMLLNPVWQWFIDAGKAAGVIPEAATYAHEWSPPPFQSIEPHKEILAKKDAIRNGIKTIKQVVAEEGYDFDEQLADIAESNAKLDALGIVLDCDPRVEVKKAEEAAAAAAAKKEPAEGEEEEPAEGEEPTADEKDEAA